MQRCAQAITEQTVHHYIILVKSRWIEVTDDLDELDVIPRHFEKAAAGKDLPRVLDLGIRPTDFSVSFSEKEGYDEYEIDFYQINGEKFIITCKRGETKFVVETRRELGVTVQLGQKIYLKWDTENFYFFDEATKNAL